MPHGGGGGHSGGGSHSSSHSSAPRYDHHGHLHSQHYSRPGFYYGSTYIPLHRKDRIRTIFSPLIFVVAGIIMMIAFSNSIGNGSGISDNWGINKYEDIYDSSSRYYEDNLLLIISVEKDYGGYDYKMIIGDDTDSYIEDLFGVSDNVFGRKVLKYVASKDYYSDLYKSLSKAVDEITNEISRKYVEIEQHCVIKNEVSFDANKGSNIEGYEDLVTSLNNFYTTSGYNLSILITDYSQLGSGCNIEDYIPVLFGALFVVIGIVAVISTAKAVKKINKAEDDGTVGQYYEGEDTWEEYTGQAPKQDNTTTNNNTENKEEKKSDDPFNWKDDF